MRKLVILFFVAGVAVSCKMKLSTRIPNMMAGRWEHVYLPGSSNKTLYLDKSGKYKIEDYINSTTADPVVTEGEYVYNYQSFHITDASGVIIFDGAANYNFVLQADKSEGRQFLSLTNGDKITEVYTYYGETVL